MSLLWNETDTGTRMSLAWTECSECGKRISIAEDGLMNGRCLLCNHKLI